MRIVLVIVAVIGFSAVIGAIVLGVVSFDGLVTDNPYEKGIDWDRARKEKERSGIAVRLLTKEMEVGRGRVRVAVTAGGGRPYEGPVEIRMSRPETSAMDRAYMASAGPEGIYSADVELQRHGYWEVRVVVPWNGKRLEFKEKIHARRAAGRK